MVRVIVDVLDRTGKLGQRHPIATFPAKIGRSFDSDVIIDDPHVDLTHLVIETNDSGLVIRDAGSLNGTTDGTGRNKFVEAVLSDQLKLKLGSTSIVVTNPAISLPPTVPLANQFGRLSAAMEKKTTAIALFVVFLMVDFVSDYYFQYRPKTPHYALKAALTSFLGHLLVFLPWAGLWSMLGAFNVHRARFSAHFSYSLVFYYLICLCYVALEYFGFAFPVLSQLMIFREVGFLIFFSALLYFHLRLSTFKAPRVARVIACSASLTILSLYLCYDYIDSSQFRNRVPLREILKPPAFMVTAPGSVDDFLAKSQPLERELRRLAAEN